MSTPEAPVRRTRSDGDIPRQPELVHLHSNLRAVNSADSQDLGHLDTLHSTHAPIPPPTALSGPPSHVPPTGTLPYMVHSGNYLDQPPRPASQRHSLSVYARVLAYFGLGRRASHARKSLVSMIWNMSWGGCQVVVIITMLILVGTHFKNPQDPSISEWTACDRPLGVWASLWVARVILASGLAYWEFLRDRVLHPTRSDTETGPQVNEPAANTTGATFGHQFNDTSPTNLQAEPPPSLPHSLLYSRLTLLSSLVTLSWFLTAHILEYTSINTCRHTSPHLWWLIFGILCIMYLMVLEVVLLGFVVLVIAPILFIFWNIFLICIGRHPMQNPGMIKPEVGKVSKSVVDSHPLVTYIPPPPSDVDNGGQLLPQVYPPKTPIAARRPAQTHFKFIRKFSSFGMKKPTGEMKAEDDSSHPESDLWQDHWEQGDFPFVTLDGNRASCAICLMDFEEPKRKNADGDASIPVKQEELPLSDGVLEGSSSPNAIPEAQQPGELKLADAGAGAQPLRLLACGHVFHKTCIDPWLIDVSGRCPVCQKPVKALKSKFVRQE